MTPSPTTPTKPPQPRGWEMTMRKILAMVIIVAFAAWVSAPIFMSMTPDEFLAGLRFVAIFLIVAGAFIELSKPDPKPRQPVPGVYRDGQGQ